jgi:hypothetical protein
MMAGLADFMDSHTSAGRAYSTGIVFRGTPSGEGVRLADSGPASRRIARAARDPGVAEQVLASLFWWCYVQTRLFESDSRGISRAPDQRRIIVSHAGGTRYDLLLLASGVGETFEVIASDDVYAGQSPRRRRALTISAVALDEGERMREMLAGAGIEIDTRSAVLAVSELSGGADFRLVVAAEPDEAPTQAPVTAEPAIRSFVAPAPALAVTVPGDARPIATAGVIGPDQADRLLVTTALHALPANAAQMMVGGAAASIVGKHELTDSCLLAVTCAAGVGVGNAGLLHFPPQAHRPASFDGASSGHKHTMIRGHDLSLLDASPYLSSKVYTEPDTVPGDSGAALIDCEDHVVGFAVSRTALGAPIEFSTWSWADQVLAAHGLAG